MYITLCYICICMHISIINKPPGADPEAQHEGGRGNLIIIDIDISYNN